MILSYIHEPPTSIVELGVSSNILIDEGTFLTKSVWRFRSNVGGLLNEQERARVTSTEFTWEDLGIPPASIINSVDISISKYLSANTNLISHDITVRLLDASNTSVTSTDPFNTTLSNTLDTTFQSVSDISGYSTVDGPYKNSNTALKVEFGIILSTSIGTTQYVLNLDQITISVNYDTPSYLNQTIVDPFFFV